MSATRADGMQDGRSPVPGVARLGWLLLMQPLVLRRWLEAWGFAGWVKWSALGKCAAAGDPVARALRRRSMALMGLWVPACGLVALGLVAVGGGEVAWSTVMIRWEIGLLVTLMAGALGSWVFALLFGGGYGSLVVVASALAGGWIEFGAKGVAFGMALTIAEVLRSGRLVRVGWMLLAAGTVASYHLLRGADDALLKAAAEGIGVLAAWSRLPLLMVEVPWMLALRVAQWVRPAAGPWLARWLPYRWDDLILVPLPGLRGFLVDVAGQDRALAEALIEEAGASMGQQGVAARAWAVLGQRRVLAGVG